MSSAAIFLLIALNANADSACDLRPVGTQLKVLKPVTLFSKPGCDDYTQCNSEKSAWPQPDERVFVEDCEIINGRVYLQVNYKDRSGLWLWQNEKYEVIPPPAIYEGKAPLVMVEANITGSIVGEGCGQGGLGLMEALDNSDHRQNPYLKSIDEIAEYMKSRIAPVHFATYNQLYRQIVHDASKAFDINEQLMTCLIFQESKWNPGAKSPTQTKGLVQMTGDTRGRLKSIISNQSPTDAQMSLQYYWKEYFETKDSAPPKRIDISNPDHSIPLAAFYFRDLINRFKIKPDSAEQLTRPLNSCDLLRFYLLLAAGYNAGDGAALKAVEKSKADPKSWKGALDVLKASGETAMHMKLIYKCMAKSEYENQYDEVISHGCALNQANH